MSIKNKPMEQSEIKQIEDKLFKILKKVQKLQLLCCHKVKIEISAVPEDGCLGMVNITVKTDKGYVFFDFYEFHSSKELNLKMKKLHKTVIDLL